MGQSKLELSGNGNECKPLIQGGAGGHHHAHGLAHAVSGRAVEVDPIKARVESDYAVSA